MTGDELRRLFELRPVMTNVAGFYDLLYQCGDITPAQRMIWEAHFATSALQLAQELYSILKDAEARRDDR